MTTPENRTEPPVEPRNAGETARAEHALAEQTLVERTLAGALQRARGAILWERAWPAIVAALLAVGVFLILSWAGLWLVVPPVWRMIGVAFCALLLVWALIPALKVRLATPTEALGRLDRETRLPHRPATALADHLASRPDDPVAVALWRAHLNRMAAQIRELRAGIPSPRLVNIDPRAVRGLVILGLVATFFMAPGDHMRRILTAFDWAATTPPTPYRVDAWVTPPPYTARPPVMLPGLRSDETQQAGAAQAAEPKGSQNHAAAVTVPAGSTLVVRITGLDRAAVTVEGRVEAAPEGEAANGAAPQPAAATKTASQTASAPQNPPQSAQPAAARPGAANAGKEQRYVIAGDGAARLVGPGGETVVWRFQAVPDRPPTIAFAKEPQGSGRTGLALSYRMEDDYGVVGAEAKFAAVPPPKPLHALKNAPPAPAARPLVAAPDFALPLPGARSRNGVGQTTKDFTESPWAGTRVTLTLVARDEAGQTGSTEAKSFVMPARNFNNPLARALIEQRRTLALDANMRERVQAALDALAIAPERFTPDVSHYMGLRSAYWRLANANSDDDLRGVVDYLWEVAVRIEDGDMSDVEKQLRAAQDALQQALERGASDEEIKKLTQDLREAMDKFLQALAEQAQRNGDQANAPPDPNMRSVRPQDLQKMLDRIEDMARNGARDAARQMLSELQNMLNGLQAGRQQQRRQGQSEMSQALDQLGDMIRQQQKLRDRTFQQGRDGQQGKDGQPQQGDQAFKDLQQNQQQLREKLRELREKMQQAMRGRGQQQQDGQRGQQGQQGQNGEGQQGEGQQGQDGQGQGPGQSLGDAEQAMREAEQALGQGDGTGAVDAQSEALQALRKGAQSMAQAMQPGPGQEPGSPSGETAERNDPLGRPMRSRDYGDDVTVKVPEEMDMQRARRVLEELRRRFGEPERPRLELDYLERLLRDF
ncbi:TIGR02302 family protein [Bosea sp. 117]|uniref:TIGR02302 family protein n=1 Tax=Bosea sp. 117 TaxID=1125973 RepID=UPI00049458FE|nr:TIGR02302 family protein [Bosea sp. 117]